MSTRTVEFREHFLSVEGLVSLSQRDLKAMREGERRLHGGHNRKAERAAARRKQNGTLQIRSGEVTHEEVPKIRGVVRKMNDPAGQSVIDDVRCETPKVTMIRIYSVAPATPNPNRRPWDGNIKKLMSDLDVSTTRR